jgi:hypothetical protein
VLAVKSFINRIQEKTGSGLERDTSNLTEASGGFTQFFQVNSGIFSQVRQDGFKANLSCEMSIHESPYNSTPHAYILSYWRSSNKNNNNK